jgi:hypothetical protein
MPEQDDHRQCEVLAMGAYQLKTYALLAILCAAANGAAFACDQTTVNTTRQADVMCYGALGNGTGDDSRAINAAAVVAVTRHVPLVLPAGRYRVTSQITIDYAAAHDTGIEVISQGAIIDGAAVSGVPVLYIYCSGGSASSPKGCFYLHLSGTLFVYANSSGWAVSLGAIDFSDAHNSVKLDHLIVNNAGASGSGVLLNYVLNADAFIVADAGLYGLALNQVQFSRISGAASAPNGWGVWLGSGYTIANTIQGFDFEEAGWCLVNNSSSSQRNTFVSPYLNCIGGVYSTGGADNLLLNPLFGGATQIQTWFSAGFKVMQ